MSRRDLDEEDWDDQDEDWGGDEYDEDYDSEEDESESTVNCPYCQAEIHEDSQRCPVCENYISHEDAPPQRRPLWLAAGVVICLIIICWRWIIPLVFLTTPKR